MDELKKSLEVVLKTVQGLEGKDQLVIFLFVRSVLEYVEACLVSGDQYDIADVFTDCCTVFQEADDVLVEKADDFIKVEAIKDGKVDRSYKLVTQAKANQTDSSVLVEEAKPKEDAAAAESGGEGDAGEGGANGNDSTYYLPMPNTEDGEHGQTVLQEESGMVEVHQPQKVEMAGDEHQQTVLECSDPSVLQAFLEEGGKLPSYLPPGSQIIIETKDGRTEVIQNTAVQPGSLDPASVKQEDGSVPAQGPDIPVFVMTEDGNMLVPTDTKPSQQEVVQPVTMATSALKQEDDATPVPTPRGRGRPRKRPMEGLPMGMKKIKLGDNLDAGIGSPNSLTFQCDQCFQYFAHEHSLHRHYRAVHMNMKWTCEDCGREFTRPDSLVNHKKKQSCFKGPGKPTVRFDPNEKFVEGQGYQCELCDIFFRNMGALKRHRETQHSGLSHDCDFCGKKFTSSSHLATHKRQACVGRDNSVNDDSREDGVPKIKSEEGVEGEEDEEAVSDNRESLDGAGSETVLSMAAVKLEAQENIEIKSIATIGSNKKGKREPGEILPKDPNDMFLCSDCGKCLSSKQALIIHMRKHTGEVPFKCQFCGHGANTRGNLLRHLESIHGVTKDDPNITLDLKNYAADRSSVDSSDDDRFLLSNVNLSQSDTFTNSQESLPLLNQETSSFPEGFIDSRDTVASESSGNAKMDTPPQTLESLVRELQENCQEDSDQDDETISLDYEKIPDSVKYSVDTKNIKGSTLITVSFKNQPNIGGESSSVSPKGSRNLDDQDTKDSKLSVFTPEIVVRKRGRPRKDEAREGGGLSVIPACPKCDKVFHNHSNLTVHMRTHTKELPFTCDYCDHCFATKANKTRHELTVHEHRKDWQCDVCNKCFTEKKSMLQHKLVSHQGGKPHTCTICDRSFSYYAALQSHMASHSSDKPHVCEFCEMSFALKNQLKQHVKLSHPDEDLSCPVCERSFVTNSDLNKHMRVHEDLEKKCQLCNAKFSLKQQLTDHIKEKHTKQKPFKCTLCENVSFYSKNALERHTESQHADSQGDDDSQPVNGDSATEEDLYSSEADETLEMDEPGQISAGEQSGDGNESDEDRQTLSKAILGSPTKEDPTHGGESDVTLLQVKTEPLDIPTPLPQELATPRGRGRPKKSRV